MNRKGQVMVGFLLLLPFLLVLFVFVVDVGLMYVENRSVENNIKEAIHYTLSQEIVDETLIPSTSELLKKNIHDMKACDVMITNGTIRIHVAVSKRATFSMILKKQVYEIDVTYQGYKENERIKIVKE